MKNSKFILSELIKTLLLVLLCISPILIIIFSEIITGDNYSESSGIFDYCEITDVDYTATLRDDSTVEIVEYLTFDIHANTKENTYKEIWRELPEQNVDGLDITYDVKYVAQILDDNREVPYIETSKLYWDDSDFTESATKYWHHSKATGIYPDNYESLIMYIPWTYREKLKFKIVYTMNNAALKYNDCSELYLSMYSGDTITKLKSYKAQIKVPNEIMPSNYYAYTYGTAKSKIPYVESDTINPGYHTFSFDLNKKDLKFGYDDKYIEFCLLAYGRDKHIFTTYAQNNLYTFDDALKTCIEENTYYETKYKTINNTKKSIFTICVAISLIIIYRTRKNIKKLKQKYTLYKPEVDYDYFREIPSDLDPIFASDLVFMKTPYDNKEKKEEYAAILLSLARKKYITITKLNDKDWNSRNTLIKTEPIETVYNQNNETNESIYEIINKDTGVKLEPWTTSERLYYELLERHSKKYNNNSITMNQLQFCINADYTYTNSFANNIEKKPIQENGIMKGFFQTNNYNKLKNNLMSQSKNSRTIALLLLILVNLYSFFSTQYRLCYGAYTILGLVYLWRYLYLMIKASEFVLFSKYGATEQAKWYGLYNFLNSDTLMNEKKIPDLVLWEKYLVYATAFGISEKVIKAIKINAEKLNVDINNSPILNTNCYVHSSSFHSTAKAHSSSIYSSSRSGRFRIRRT